MNNIVYSLIDAATPREDGKEGFAGEVNTQRLVELTVQEFLRVLEMKGSRPQTNRHWEAIGRELSFVVREHFGLDDE